MNTDQSTITTEIAWMFENIRPYLQGRILEMSSGTGSISSFLIENQIPLHLNETDQESRHSLRKKFKDNPLCKSVHKIDFHHPDFEKTYAEDLGKFTTILKLNNPKNTQIDTLSINNLKLLMRDDGNLVLLIPANTTLYNGLDNLDDLKRYNHQYLTNLLSQQFGILKVRYLNFPSTVDPLLFSRTGLYALVAARTK
jgi:hypothetical protein